MNFLHIKSFFFITFLGLFFSCSQTNHIETEEFLLLPSVAEQNFSTEASKLQPYNLRYAYSESAEELPVLFGLTAQIEKTTAAEKAQIEYRINPVAESTPEGYTLTIGLDKITIEGQDEAGLMYGFITLNQLMEDAQSAGVNLPQLIIKDAPKIAYRPIQIDVKHHLEQKSYYYQLMDELAQLKINGIILEIEDKLKYKRRPEVGSADALSIEEWQDLSEYANQRNIKISPLVQGLGHASFVLKHEQNKHLRDDPQSDWAFNPLDPETYTLQFDLYLDALEAFPHGKYLHVGGDEVQTSGRGSGKSALELNLIWLNKVTAFAAEQGRTPIFWDDMPLKQAGLMSPIYNANMSPKTVDSIWQVNAPKLNRFLEDFPKNCVYMRWNYHLAESYGNGKAMDWFSSNGFQVMGATAGQTRWTLMPQRESNIDQIRIFVEQSIQRNYNGLLLTLWDDDSPHFELYKRGIYAFSEYAWGGLQRSKGEFKKAYRHRKFGAEFQSEEYDFIDDLDQPVALWTNLLVEEGIHRNSLYQRDNPIEKAIITLPDYEQTGKWSEKYTSLLSALKLQYEQLKTAQEKQERLYQETQKSNYNLEVYSQIVKLVGYNFRLMQALNDFDLADTDEEKNKQLLALQKYPAEFEDIRAEFETVYSQTRRLEKPENYILDQDHHRHPANQTRNFDWQFSAELLLLEKLENHFKTQPYWGEGQQQRLQ